MHVKLECGFAVQGRHVAVVLLCRCVFADFASSLCVVFFWQFCAAMAAAAPPPPPPPGRFFQLELFGLCA